MEDKIIQEARQLIMSKRYEEARDKLEQISEHPTAQKWLKKLDEVAPQSTPMIQDRRVDNNAQQSLPSIGELASRVSNKQVSNDFDDDLSDIEELDAYNWDNIPPPPNKPNPNPMPLHIENSPNYGSLRIIMNVYKISGAFAMFLTVVAAAINLVSVFSAGNSYFYVPPITIVFSSLVIFVSGGILSASLYAVGELIHIVLSMEENIRISTQLQSSVFKQLLELNQNIKQ